MTEDNISVLKRANAAVASGDHEGFLAACTDDTTWIFVGDQTLPGKDEVRRWMAETYRSPPENEVHRIVAKDDLVIATGEIVVRDAEDRPVRSAYCDVWRLRDGMVAELHAFVIEGARLSG